MGYGCKNGGKVSACALVFNMLRVGWDDRRIERNRTMAGRPPKKGIDYAGWSVDIFDNDTKIDKLLDAHGWNGFGIYFYLCQRAYGSEGYFYKWGYDDCASTSRKMGGGIGSGTIREVVGYCLQIGLFDKGLFDRWGVLTSRGIQRRYWEVVKARDVRTVISDYWLLQNEECKGLIKLPLNSDLSSRNANFPAGNLNYPEGNANFPAIKESKVKERKVKQTENACVRESKVVQHLEKFLEVYPKKCNRHLAEVAYADLIINGLETEENLIICAKNYAEACQIEKTQERYIKNAQNFLKDMTFENYLPEKYKRPELKNKNGFANFPQREYSSDDFRKMEEILLNQMK